tara:strand:+ start:2341 stop:2682 length:342 start_codon:yes stop_codon:yes gene_type:complete
MRKGTTQYGHYQKVETEVINLDNLEVGTVIDEEDIESLPTGRGRKWMLNENPIWISAMNKADGKYVVLEKLPLTPTTKSRIANRVVKYNKTFDTYKFKSKSAGEYIYFFGASC